MKAKTVTGFLSREQYVAFKKAVAANRKNDSLLAQMREHTKKTLLGNLPGVTRRPRIGKAAKTQ